MDKPLEHRQASWQRIARWMLWGGHDGPSTYFVSRRLFLRLLGLVYLIAFASLAVQIIGLIGERGILPAHEYLELLRERIGSDRFWKLPTICWWWHSDAALNGICWIGAGLSGLLIFGVAPIPILILLWALYLSICSVGRDFLQFQWDTLLLETGLLAIFFAPGNLWPQYRKESAVSLPALFLIRWLLFRLMFLSGAVKLASGDRTWHDMTALTVHYETQPLAVWTSWYAHHLPLWFQKLSCGIMFFLELGLPFFIWGPRRFRQFACGGFVFLMILIGATGNYNFFNLITCVLCVTLLDDAALARFVPRRWRQRVEVERPYRRPNRWLGLPMIAVAAMIFGLTWIEGWDRLHRGRQRATPGTLRTSVERVREAVFPFRSLNSYGLFANMTETRPEIVVEGSHDGREWFAYEFRWKAGGPSQPPRFVQPHQPRLDWQMWFAALRNYRSTPWFQQFLRRLLEGSPDVLALLDRNPFPNQPPKYVRALLYRYRFTDPKIRRETGQWWSREYLGVYCQPVSLQRP